MDRVLWAMIPGFKPYYRISSTGVVVTRGGRVMKPVVDAQGYLKIGLTPLDGRKQATAFVHRLVMSAFVGPKPKGWQVNHRDKNRANPHLENLEYVTCSENHLHAYANGRKGRGPRLTEALVREIRASCEPTYLLARRMGLSFATVSQARSGRTWGHVL